MKHVDVLDLGMVPYKETWQLQAAIQQRIIDEKLKERREGSDAPRSNDLLLLVEHPHVYTLGKSGDQRHLLKSDDELEELEASFVKIDRGGDITYHGPGQVVGYPIMDLDRHFTDIHRYLRYLEEIFIRLCSEYGIQAGRFDGLTGVWVNGSKICALGIKCSRWVTMHGFAFNLNPSLDYFDHIVPCGIDDKSVTSLSRLLGRDVPLEEIKSRILHHFQEIFGVQTRTINSLPELENGDFSFFKEKSN